MKLDEAHRRANRSQARRKRWSGILIALTGVLAGVAATPAMAFLASYLRQRACPADTFIYGATPLGAVIAIVPWFFTGMIGFWWAIDVVAQRLRSYSAHAGPPTRAERGWSKLLRGASGGLFVFSILVLPFATLAGFCATGDGIAFKRLPWAPATNYAWQDVISVTVVCYYRSGRGGGSYNSYWLRMKDGAEIDLFQTPRSFDEGFAAVRLALRNVPLDYDTSQVRSSCASILRNLPRL